MQNLKGKVALVTGSGRRIGAVTVKALHQAGATVVVHYRNSAIDAEKLCAELNQIREGSCFLQQADLLEVASFPEMIKSILQKTGRLDILINNASSFYPTKVGQITEQHWDDLMGSNLKAPLFLSQAVAGELKKNNGCIVNMVDIYGISPLKEHPVYSSAKAGLIMLTKSLAKELGPEVRVNGVAPGVILWPENEAELADGEISQQALLDKSCLKRQGSPHDIAETILFLVEKARFITGHVIPVDGGRL